MFSRIGHFKVPLLFLYVFYTIIHNCDVNRLPFVDMRRVYSRHVAGGGNSPGNSEFPPEICPDEFSKSD